jgi:L-threonylcarbamoyladenylate synthase
VRTSLGDRVDYILDGGPCSVGIESTVLSLTEDPPIVLRPGGISRAEIEAVIGRVRSLHTEATASQLSGSELAHAAPGMHRRHYSPRTALYLVENGLVSKEGRGVYLQLSRPPEGQVLEVMEMPSDPVAYAAKLYETLHLLDGAGFDWIAVETPPDLPEWEAVRDRLRRAAGRG